MQGEPEPVLFVYGTLRAPEVLSALLGRVPDRSPAAVLGRRAAALRGRVYPGLVPAPAGHRLDGEVIHGLAGPEWRTLHAFEGPMYDLCPLDLADGGGVALAYVLTADQAERHALDEDWSYERFRSTHLAAYVADCTGQ